MKFRPSFTGILFALVGAVTLIWGAFVLVGANASSAWPSVQGEVTKSKVEKKTEQARRDGRTATKTTFWHRVHYRYVVEGTEYSGDKVSFGDYGGSKKHASEVVDRYPMGKAVDVHYDPQKPEVAVLETGVSGSSFIVPGVGLGLIIAGIAICFGMGRNSGMRIRL